MSWLKRQQPITLHQSSEMPYVILEDGVRLCFDNCYEEKESEAAHVISFHADKSKLARISTNFYKLKDFPVDIPFEDVVRLNDTIIEGKIIKQANIIDDDSTIKVIIVHGEYLNQNDDSVNRIADEVESADYSIMLHGEVDNPKARLFEDIMHMSYHVDWNRTVVEMADHVCKLGHRKYCWTKSLPSMNVHCYGLTSTDDAEEIHTAMDTIKIQNFSVTWKD